MFKDTIRRVLGSRVDIKDTESGLYIMLTVKAACPSQEMSRKALERGCRVAPIQNYYWEAVPECFPQVILYFSKIPAGEMETAVKLLEAAWF